MPRVACPALSTCKLNFVRSLHVQVATELLDDSLLGSGLLPAVRQALYGTCFGFGGSHVPSPDASRQQPLLTPDAVVVPRAATVWAQAVEVGVPPPERLGGLDMSPLDRYRCERKAWALGLAKFSVRPGVRLLSAHVTARARERYSCVLKGATMRTGYTPLCIHIRLPLPPPTPPCPVI